MFLSMRTLCILLIRFVCGRPLAREPVRASFLEERNTAEIAGSATVGRKLHSTVLGCWGLDRIPAVRLAEPAHAERVNLRVEECVGVEQNVGISVTRQTRERPLSLSGREPEVQEKAYPQSAGGQPLLPTAS